MVTGKHLAMWRQSTDTRSSLILALSSLTTTSTHITLRNPHHIKYKYRATLYKHHQTTNDHYEKNPASILM